MKRQLFSDLALVVARVVLGVILIARGWQKFVTNGLDATSQGFAGMGVPLPTFSAGLAGTVELIGGLALIVGAFTTIAGTAVALVMFGAFWFAHAGGGVFAAEGGWELVGALAVGALALAAAGAGRFSVDALLARRSSREVAAPAPARESVHA